MSIYRNVLEELNAGKKVVVLTILGDGDHGTSQPEKAYYTEAEIESPRFAGSAGSETGQLIQETMAAGELRVATTPEYKMLVAEPFFPAPRLIIFGGGHIGKTLCEFGAKLGFLVTVVDDRAEFANTERFPDADQVICESFEKSFERLQFGPHTYVVLVTRGHRHDLLCLREVVKKTWAYAGMIGSRRRAHGVKEQLANEGAHREVLEKVNAPIGLDIGGVTPEEITMSILAQVISYRRLEDPKLGRESARIKGTEYDPEVIEELGVSRNGAKAMATVISTKGSTPRGVGAKMLVWPDGTILGSVGGGGGEGAVIKTAREVVGRGGYVIQDIDMTSCFTDDGMVCGGTMKVLIESWRD